MLKKCTNDLKNLNEQELFLVVKEIIDGKHKFSNEEIQTICKRTLQTFIKIINERRRERDFVEILRGVRFSDIGLSHKQYTELKEIYILGESQNWEKCRIKLEIFFSNETPRKIKRLFLTGLNYRHLIRWFGILIFTNLFKEPEGSLARISYVLISYFILLDMPLELRDRYENGFENGQKNYIDDFNSIPEFRPMTIGDQLEYKKVIRAAKTLGISENEIIDALYDEEFGLPIELESQICTLQSEG
jgi:hypothetical protein